MLLKNCSKIGCEAILDQIVNELRVISKIWEEIQRKPFKSCLEMIRFSSSFKIIVSLSFKDSRYLFNSQQSKKGSLLLIFNIMCQKNFNSNFSDIKKDLISIVNNILKLDQKLQIHLLFSTYSRYLKTLKRAEKISCLRRLLEQAFSTSTISNSGGI